MRFNSIPNYRYNIPLYNNQFRYRPNDQDRFGGFLLPFALGFVSSPLIFGATRPRPPYPYPYYPNGYYPYY